MRFSDLNWFDVEDYLAQDDRLMIILGATEQHGYLSLLTDVNIPLALADAANEQTNVLIAPPFNFGISPYFLDYPGTISLRVTTMLAVVEDVIRSVYRHGVRRILVLNGHGGNDPARARLSELVNELRGLRVSWYSWWQAPNVRAVAHKYNLEPNHANWLEAFPFNRVAELPDYEKPTPVVTEIMNAETTREVYEDGSFGGRYVVSDKIMNEVFNAALGDILGLLEFGE
ncbi:MAG TPA: creatininase family protein [Anaerolineales bacterium]|jgi:creatinine amidohydrolase|nr:creatininase family protein [Anaerolineales bacterium]